MKLTPSEQSTTAQRAAAGRAYAQQKHHRPSETFDWDNAIARLQDIFDSLERKQRR